MITFNEASAEAVFTTLAKAWRKQQWIFKKESLPQNYAEPPKEDRAHANFLFFLALLQRGPAVSESATVWAKALFKSHPEMFDPDSISKLTLLELDGIFRGALASLQEKGEEKGTIEYRWDDFLLSWLTNASQLVKYWKSDAREIFKGVKDFEEAYKRINPNLKRNEAAIRGMRRKIVSLLFIWLQDRNLIPQAPSPIPLDFHALRILWACDIVVFNGYERLLEAGERERLKNLEGLPTVRVSEKMTDEIALWSQPFIQKIGARANELNPALWILSRTLCKLLPENRSKGVKGREGTIELKGFSPKKNPCAACPIHKHCKWAVPNGPHSRFGYLVRRPRTLHPQPALPGTEGY